MTLTGRKGRSAECSFLAPRAKLPERGRAYGFLGGVPPLVVAEQPEQNASGADLRELYVDGRGSSSSCSARRFMSSTAPGKKPFQTARIVP